MNTVKAKAAIIKKIKKGGIDISKITDVLSRNSVQKETLLPMPKERTFHATQVPQQEQGGRISYLEKLLDQKGKEIAESNRGLDTYAEAVKSKMMGNFQAVQKKKDVLEDEVKTLKSEIAAKNERLVKIEDLHKQLDGVVKDLALKLSSSEEVKKELEEKILHLSAELKAKDEKFSRIDSLRHKEKEMMANDLTLKLRSFEEVKKGLKEKISHLSAELEAKDKKFSQVDSVYSKEKGILEARLLRLGFEVQSKTEKLDSAEKLRIKLESEVKNRESEKILDEERLYRLKAELDIAKDLISSLRLEIETRDRKIEADIGYCERILKELGGLRRK